MKLSDRFSIKSLIQGVTDKQGCIFINDKGETTDLTNVELVGSSVDTVRQLFEGLPNLDMVKRLETFAEHHQDIVTLTDITGLKTWHFTRMGKVARYRYKLQDNEEGIVILFGSYFQKLDKVGQHLKVELSPHYIGTRSVAEIWQRLNDKRLGLSTIFLDESRPSGCAIHLACDYQGFDLPNNFIETFSTYSRTMRSYDGLNSIDLSDISEAVASYGGATVAKNYLIGKPSAVQFCLYDKSHEIIKSDKVDYFHEQWGKYSQGVHNPDNVTRRIEARLHHQVIRDIGNGMGKDFDSFINIVPHLTDLWQYAMKNNRLNSDIQRKHLHPFWQLLMEDVTFGIPSTGLRLVRKKKDSVSPIGKNIGLALGNMMTIYARQNMTTKVVMHQLQKLTFYPEIVDYYYHRGLGEDDLREYVEKSLCLRRLIGKVAA